MIAWLTGLLSWSSVKVFVYPVPDDLTQLSREVRGGWWEMYHVELLLPRLFDKTGVEDADYFYIPAAPASFYHRCLEVEDAPLCQDRTAEYLEKIIQWIDENYGVFLATETNLIALTMDRSLQFFEPYTPLYRLLCRMVILQHDGSREHSPLTGFRPGHDLTIPTFRRYEEYKFRDKTIIGYFRGTFKPDEPRYGHGYRHAMWELSRNYPHLFYVKEGQADGYWQELTRAKWALCPEGWVPWSPRFYDALQAGAMPIILSSSWIPPVDYQFPRLNLTEMHLLPEMVMQEPPVVPVQVANAVRWNYPAQPGDAFHYLLKRLAQRLAQRKERVGKRDL